MSNIITCSHGRQTLIKTRRNRYCMVDVSCSEVAMNLTKIIFIQFQRKIPIVPLGMRFGGPFNKIKKIKIKFKL